MLVNYTMWKNNYSEARHLFREYCSKTYNDYNKKSGNFFIDGDKETTIDYLFLQHEQSRKLHILISGTHGVEGYAGSAIQFKTLDTILKKSESSSDLRNCLLSPRPLLGPPCPSRTTAPGFRARSTY